MIPERIVTSIQALLVLIPYSVDNLPRPPQPILIWGIRTSQSQLPSPHNPWASTRRCSIPMQPSLCALESIVKSPGLASHAWESPKSRHSATSSWVNYWPSDGIVLSIFRGNCASYITDVHVAGKSVFLQSLFVARWFKIVPKHNGVPVK